MFTDGLLTPISYVVLKHAGDLSKNHIDELSGMREALLLTHNVFFENA
jgi:hypothetical protein